MGQAEAAAFYGATSVFVHVPAQTLAFKFEDPPLLHASSIDCEGSQRNLVPAIHDTVLRASPATLLEMLSSRPHPRDMGSEPASSKIPGDSSYIQV